MGAVEALAEVYASMDGHLEQFQKERAITRGGFASSSVVGEGRFAGYMAEAEEMIDRLRTRGFDVLPVRKSAEVINLRGNHDPNN